MLTWALCWFLVNWNIALSKQNIPFIVIWITMMIPMLCDVAIFYFVARAIRGWPK